MINLTSELDIQRLFTTLDSARDAMRPFRENRQKMLREFVGRYYSDWGADYEVLVNLLNMTADVYTIGLAATNPKVNVSTRYQDLWSFAHRFKIGINNQIKEMHFAETLQGLVEDALFGFGIAKTHLDEGGIPIQLENDVWADPGKIYVSRCSVDDFVLDLAVKDRRRCRFMADEYRVSWEAARAHPAFDRKVLDKLYPTSKHDRGEEQANDISSGSLTDDDEYEPMVDLMDVWMPELQATVTFPRHRQTRPLMVQEEDNEGGPYDLLTFAEVPDNVLPSSPMSQLFGLHKLFNGLLRKQARQAKRQKTNPAFRPDAQDDASRMMKAVDGQWVKVRDPSGINVVQQGGVAQENVAFSMGIMDLFDRQAGNLSAMAGLGAQADTVGQEELIHAAVSRKEAKMQQRVHSFTANLMEKVGHLMWMDEFLEQEGSFEVAPGTGVFVDASWEPDLREGDFWQYNFDIQPHSMDYESPEQKIRKLERAMDRLAGPFFPLIQANGGMVDVQELTKIYAEYLGVPELENVISFAQEPLIQRPGPEGMPMPAQTTRNYVRRNVPTGGTPQSRSAALQQTLYGSSGSNLNGAQREAMTRTTG